ncbi:MAG: hypothetical protein DRO36_03690 [Candidatus Hecatellales archaeon]|nr:MAG: hypothetical protein DRO36_03690 [Candidatus Hecatellales archaeon]
MYLTREEEKMLDGEYGEGLAKCMRLLVVLGEIFEAEKMVRVKSCHVSGVSYKNIGEPGLELLKSFAMENVRVKVKKTTLNPSGMDRKKWRRMGLPENFVQKQTEILKAFKRVGVNLTCSCTPYLAGNKPKPGDYVAWSESSATVYVNSVLGARTNRESGLSALASAITGRTPYYGYLLDENRKPNVKVKVKFKPSNVVEAGGLGYLIGKIFPERVPFFSGLGFMDFDWLKALGAGLASSGAVTLYHVENLTPEAKLFDGKCLAEAEKFEVEREDVKKAVEDLSEAEERFDAVFLGCPHYSLNQLKDVAYFLRGRKVKAKLWVFTSRSVYVKAKGLGYVGLIEKAGGLVLCDTCMVVSPLENLGLECVCTDSCKAAHYLPSTNRVKVKVKSPFECLEAIS